MLSGTAVPATTDRVLLDGLRRALAAPAGLPLQGAKAGAALFGASAASRAAAQRCRSEGLVSVLRTESRGPQKREICALSERGLSFLVIELGPADAVRDLSSAISAYSAEVGALSSAAARLQTTLNGLRRAVETTLVRLAPADARLAADGNADWIQAVFRHLERRAEAGATGDCPLPELFGHARRADADLSVGRFHDGLRLLYAEGRMGLQPWTGPLYELPEPELALLVGHEVAYYASRPSSAPDSK